MTPATRTALGLPGLTVAAFTNRKLAPDLQRDLDATIKEAESWAAGGYARALARRDSLSDSERDSVVRAIVSLHRAGRIAHRSALAHGGSHAARQLPAAAREESSLANTIRE